MKHIFASSRNRKQAEAGLLLCAGFLTSSTELSASLTISRQSELIPAFPRAFKPCAVYSFVGKLLGWKLRVNFLESPLRMTRWCVTGAEAYAAIEKSLLMFQGQGVNPEIRYIRTSSSIATFRRLSE